MAQCISITVGDRFKNAIGIKNRLSGCWDFAWNIQMDALKMGVKMDILLYLQLPINNSAWTCRFKEERLQSVGSWLFLQTKSVIQ